MTHGGGSARPTDEYRIQITGVSRFEPEPDGKTLILGWWAEVGIFSGFDYRKHAGPLGASPSMQIREQFLREAYEHGFSPCNKGNREIAIAFRPDFFMEFVRFLEDLHDVGKSPVDFEVLADIAKDPQTVNDSDLEKVSQQRRTAVASVRRVLRDTSFKDRVLTSYSHQCAVCSLQMDLVEAAHIVPAAAPGSTDETSNGMTLCVLHHKAYDKAIIAVDDQYHILMSMPQKRRLQEIGHDGGMESFIRGLRPLIVLPPEVRDRPNVKYLKKGREIREWVA